MSLLTEQPCQPLLSYFIGLDVIVGLVHAQKEACAMSALFEIVADRNQGKKGQISWRGHAVGGPVAVDTMKLPLRCG